MPINPWKVSCDSKVVRSSNPRRARSGEISSERRVEEEEDANARTRRPRRARDSICLRIESCIAGVRGIDEPSGEEEGETIWEQDSKTRSTAPLVKIRVIPELLWQQITDIFLIDESNGNSAICIHSDPDSGSDSDEEEALPDEEDEEEEAPQPGRPNRVANTRMAISVGSPVACQWDWSTLSTLARLAREAMSKYCSTDGG